MTMITGSRAEVRAAWAFMSPSLLLYSFYVLFPILFTIYLSFTEWDGISALPIPQCLSDASVSCLVNYKELFQDDVFWKSFTNNLIWIVFFSISPLVGLALALFFHTKGWMASFYKSLFFAPMVFSLVVVGTIWSWFLQPQFGLVEHLLKAAGVLGPDEQFGLLANPTWASAGLIITACWPHAAYCMVLYLAGLSNLQKNVMEAAEIDGVSRWQLLWHIVIPMLRPATIIVITVTMIGALRTFDVVAVMTGGGPFNSTNVLANYMYQQTFENFRYGLGAAIGVVLFAVSLVLIVIYLRQVKRAEL